jgi:hypothetical protein
LIHQAGLFSAILTAFIIEVYKGLQEDPASTSVQVLLRISMQLNGSFEYTAPFPPKYSPSTTMVTVNMFWFLSLILSLFAALLGILVKQWLHVYSKWPEREQHKDTVVLRCVYQESFLLWHVPEIIGLLPVLLQIALLLFVVGLVTYMWTLNFAVAGALSALVTTMILVVLVTIALPFFAENCPYKSPVGLFIAASKAKYFGGSEASNFFSWQRRDLIKAKHRLKNQLASNVTVQSGLVLDLAPRSDLELELKNLIKDNTLLGSRIRGLSKVTLYLLSDLVIDSTRRTRDQSEGGGTIEQALYASHLLEYITRVAIGDTRKSAAEAIMDIVAQLGDSFKDGIKIVWNMLQRDMQEKQRRT